MAFNSSTVVERMGLSSTQDAASVDSVTLFVLLLCSCILFGHLLQKSKWMTESVVALIIGIITGIIILLTTGGKSSRILVFDEDLFFIYLLPPIIFNAGFQVKKKQFFRNFLAIMLYGVLGSLISFLIVSLGSIQLFKMLDIDLVTVGDYFALGAVFSATDSVCTLQVLDQDETPHLYSLVFGEGVVNDATSVVLFNAIQKLDLSHITPANITQFIGNFLYLFLTSTLLGIVVGLFSAYLIKKLYFGRHSTDREIALMILMAYFSYMLAELLDLSGILTVFFCGIVMSHYTWHNVTENSKITSRHAFATFSLISEIFIFLYVGMDALDIEKWRFASNSPWTLFGASAILLSLVLLGRAAFVFPLSFIANLFRKSRNDKIAFKQQVVIWWSGLMRGAVSIALAYNKFTTSGHTQVQGNAIMITSTITVVLLTNVVGGLLTKPLVKFLLDPHVHVGGSSMSSGLFSAKNLPLLTNGQDIESSIDTGNPLDSSKVVHQYWRTFDDTFMRPVFGGRGFVPIIPASTTEDNIH
ncbi:PREDICTED: sodium/hydrogen exchanger 2-like isoform X1 [Lupinus angustifolius]|uniref:sodium/hydrogen exchanger 2-like isoform X1 n=1 Tax=Lupinus angustifolius TaxID=3871 RepID=UPI00092E72B1|nr:PREDICTED: sodium/hydrogen exchanger 2-like isoform X1 [Lupinus angustifolius]XP_019429136.1 PREDICTED: sodium/hydrogen exchanger 2-like isoform X1 [Lupinus angustifolius]